MHVGVSSELATNNFHGVAMNDVLPTLKFMSMMKNELL